VAFSSSKQTSAWRYPSPPMATCLRTDRWRWKTKRRRSLQDDKVAIPNLGYEVGA